MLQQRQAGPRYVSTRLFINRFSARDDCFTPSLVRILGPAGSIAGRGRARPHTVTSLGKAITCWSSHPSDCTCQKTNVRESGAVTRGTWLFQAFIAS
ncbi:hypothetical protein FKM82_009279 [Ascaphus truei]